MTANATQTKTMLALITCSFLGVTWLLNARHNILYDVPDFFSWMVSWVQSSFMRSRSCIHSSACSVWGMPSQRFSMLARVGLEMAWVEAAARWTRAGEALGARAAARSMVVAGVRSIVSAMCV